MLVLVVSGRIQPAPVLAMKSRFETCSHGACQAVCITIFTIEYLTRSLGGKRQKGIYTCRWPTGNSTQMHGVWIAHKLWPVGVLKLVAWAGHCLRGSLCMGRTVG